MCADTLDTYVKFVKKPIKNQDRTSDVLILQAADASAKQVQPLQQHDRDD